MKKAVWTDPITGNLSILNPAYGDLITRLKTESDDDFLRRMCDRILPSAVTYEVIDDTAIEIAVFLANREFRDAWELSGGLQVNMSKARDIHNKRILFARDRELAALDQLPSTPVRESRKTKLRDIEQTYNLTTFTTPSALTAFWPDDLERI